MYFDRSLMKSGVGGVKKNIIGGILDVLHWASWADYIGYIGLTPHMGTQCGTIPIYSNIPLQS
jgi:hypothetical protein